MTASLSMAALVLFTFTGSAAAMNDAGNSVLWQRETGG